jgi:hypothetical protein
VASAAMAQPAGVRGGAALDGVWELWMAELAAVAMAQPTEVREGATFGAVGPETSEVQKLCLHAMRS